MIESMPVKTIPLPTPFAVGNINSYLITADPVTLVDPGLYYRPSMEVLTRALDDNGLRMSDVKRVVITHGHPDHFGMAGRIRKDTGAEILVREEEAVKIIPDRGFIEDMVRSLKSTGMPEEILNFNWNVVFGARVPYTHPIEGVTTYTGEVFLEFRGFQLKMLHMPGHSGGHTCLHWEEEGIMLSGDLLLPDITSIPSAEYDPTQKNLRRRGLSEIFESMERIRGMNLSLCLPGHGGPITDPGRLAQSRVDFHRNRLDEIYGLVPRGRENAATPYEISKVYYPHVQGFDKFLAVIEVVSHLDRLSDEGRIEDRICREGVSHFSRP